jgi:hypothetical protein
MPDEVERHTLARVRSTTNGEALMDKAEFLKRLQVSIQLALTGEVHKRMIAVTCGVRGKEIVVRTYVEGAVTPSDLDAADFIIDQDVFDDYFDEGYTVKQECFSGKYDELEMLDFWAFYRERDA